MLGEGASEVCADGGSSDADCVGCRTASTRVHFVMLQQKEASRAEIYVQIRHFVYRAERKVILLGICQHFAKNHNFIAFFSHTNRQRSCKSTSMCYFLVFVKLSIT